MYTPILSDTDGVLDVKLPNMICAEHITGIFCFNAALAQRSIRICTRQIAVFHQRYLSSVLMIRS
jgi:hypothetical protein